MSTVIYNSPIFGPVHSRRLGISLGINLMPDDGKICTFDCIYCECGFNADFPPRHHRPSRQDVCEGLEQQLRKMQQEDRMPDVITFAGNGEPTVHPDFSGIIDDTIRLRDLYCPEAKVAVLSNATRITKPEVHAALAKVDDNIQKLDTVSEGYIRLVDRPVGAYDLQKIIEALCRFNGHVIIQTMFLTGTFDDRSVDNTSEDFVRPWLETIEKIRPEKVMIYTIDRETPAHTLSKASPEKLDAIAERVRALGVECSVAY